MSCECFSLHATARCTHVVFARHTHVTCCWKATAMSIKVALFARDSMNSTHVAHDILLPENQKQCRANCCFLALYTCCSRLQTDRLYTCRILREPTAIHTVHGYIDVESWELIISYINAHIHTYIHTYIHRRTLLHVTARCVTILQVRSINSSSVASI